MNRTWASMLLRALLSAAFLVYALIVVYLLFIRNRLTWMRFQGVNALHDSWQYPVANLRPFRTIRQYALHPDAYNLNTWVQMLFGNLVLFLPFGILLPLISRRMRSFPFFAAVLLLVLLGVELTQKWTNTGAFDVDDILLNAAGGFTGFAVVRPFLHRVDH